MPMKLLDYGEPRPFGEIFGKSRNLEWPVNAYRVTLPKTSKDGSDLNPFECLILKYIDAAGAMTADALGQETCLPVDLVQCVLLRLQDRAFIDDHNRIVEQRRHDWIAKEEQPTIFVTALLFRELATGKILPFLHSLGDANPLRKKEQKFHWPDIFTIRSSSHHENNSPTPRDVLAALRGMKKRLIAFDDKKRLPTVGQIDVANESESYYLDCPIAIQKSDGEFRIADPFGNGFSLVLETAFSRLLEEDGALSSWLMDWRQRLTNPEMEKPAETHKEPYDNDENFGRYPNLVSNLRLKQNAQHRSIEQIYAALEWALFYACVRFPYNAAISELRLLNHSEHPRILEAVAERVGLQLPQNSLRPVPSGKLDDFLLGKAELGTVLCLALLQTEANPSHPLWHIAASHPDSVIRMFEIKKKRDEQTHGRGTAQRNVIELPEEAFMRQIITTLLPTMEFSGFTVAEMDGNIAADFRLDARTSIQGEFGFKLFNRLGTNLQDGLIHIEEFWLSCKEVDDACPFVVDICAVLQRAFKTKLQGVLPPTMKESEFFIVAQDNANQAGFGQLPTCLRTVKSSAVQKTLLGDNQTLGACVIAFLIATQADVLHTFADCQPSFLTDIEEIIQNRGHGNQPLPLAKADIARLRKQSYSIIRALVEV